MDFKSKVFRRFYIPGLVIEIILILCVALPESINPLYDISILKQRIGGPPGIAIQAALLPLEMVVVYFFIVAGLYSIVLPISYMKRSDRFIKSTRNFLIYGDLTLTVILFPIIALFCAVSPQDIKSYLNLPVAISILAFGCIMYGFFIYWTMEVYKHENLKLFSKETLKSVGLSVVIIAGFSLLICGIFMLTI